MHRYPVSHAVQVNFRLNKICQKHCCLLFTVMSLGEQLYVAAKSGDVEAVERLLVEGANIEYVGSVSEVLIFIYLFIYFLQIMV